MARKITMGTKIALALTALVTGVLGLVIGVVAWNIDDQIRRLTLGQNLELSEARAAQIGELIEKVRWQLEPTTQRPEFYGPSGPRLEATVLGLQGAFSPEVLQVVWADTEGQYLTSAGARGSIADRSYFRAVVQEGRSSFVSEPVVSKSLGIPIVVVAVAIHNPAGETVGLLGAMISLENLSAITSKITVGKTGYGWVVDGTGLILAHRDPAAVMTLNVTDADRSGYQGLDAVGRQMISGEPGSGSFRKPDGVEYVTYFQPIPSSPGWTLGISMTRAEVDELATKIVWQLLALLAVATLGSAALAALLGRRLAQPLRQATEAFRRLASGDADLSVRLTTRGSDEVADLIGGFNEFLAKLQGLVAGVKRIQTELTATTRTLGEASQTSVATAARVSAQVVQIETLARAQAHSAQESSTAVEEVTQNIESLDQQIAVQATSLTEASAAVEELVSSVASIRQTAEKLSSQFGVLVELSDQGHARAEVTAGKVKAIAEQSETLAEANRVISEIASQTNLLAMNAAIEAAHAGEAGRGFSVVADEIRKLAENAALQSRAIGNELQNVARAIDEVLAATKDSEDSLSRIRSQAGQTEGLVRTVFHALAEQQAGSTQILESLKQINRITSEVRQGSGEMREGNAVILTETQAVRQGASAMDEALAEVGQAVVEINAAGQVLDRLVGSTAGSIAELEGSVGRFRVE